MEFQVQRFQNVDKKRVVDDLDIFVGLHSPLDSPYNIFLRLKDIETSNSNIYFYGYSLGKQRVIVWGIYDRSTNQFLIDNACKYNPNDLKTIIDTWSQHKYNFFFTAMRDRMSDRLHQYKIYGDDRKQMLELIQQFKNVYMAKLAQVGILSQYNDNSSPRDDNDYQNVLKQVYTAGFKSVKTSRDILNTLYNYIENKQDTVAVSKIIETGIQEGTPYQINVAKHILIHLFIIEFLTVDDYRVVKYLEYINKNSDKQKLLKTHIVGSFIY